MLIKKADDKAAAVAELEALQAHAKGSGRRRIEEEQRAVRAGVKGERDAAYLIDFEFERSQDMAVIHDLRLEFEGRVAQIDHLLIHRSLHCFVLETKHFHTGLNITETGEFLRATGRKEGFEGMPSRLDFGWLVLALKARLRRVRIIALTCGTVLSGTLILSTTSAHLNQDPEPKATTTPRLFGHYFITGDRARLPMRSWLPEVGQVKAVIVALHGFNDYSAFFEGPGNYFKYYGIASYAYDQRGFGGAPERGSWAGTPTYLHDLSEFIRLIRDRHPGVPTYLLGESMGAAEIIVALTDHRPPPAEGIILSAPAVWAWNTMPWYQRDLLWLAAHSVPWLELTGKRLHVLASDNIEMPRALHRDPWVIKETRVDTIYGLVDLMSQAFERAKRLNQSTLVLYGELDEIIPKQPVYQLLKTVPQNGDWHVAFYKQGYHLLLRDLQAPRLWQDIAAWIENPARGLPSGADRRAIAVLGGDHS
jgi:alpha-beta hydrolase superfamily lysophospholipase